MTATLVDHQQSDAARVTEVVDLLRRTIIQLQPGLEHLGELWPQLTIQQLRVMRILYNEGPTRVSVLAQRLAVSTPTVTGILDRLVQRGMTAREDDPNDRRVVLNVLTAEGHRVIERLHPIQSDRLHAVVSRLSEDDQQALVAGLTVLLSVAGRNEPY
jgi:DNA-binding MarR family transcriptional regulator